MPDLVLLDVMLPDGSGYDVCRELRGLRGADHHAHRARRGDRPHRRPRARRRRLHRQAVQRARGGRADPRGAAPRGRPRPRAEPATATSPLEVGPVRARPGAARRDARRRPSSTSPARSSSSSRLLMARPARVITRERLIDEVWDANWFGSTKTLDVHVGGLRRKLGDDSAEPALHPHRPRRGLPLRRPAEELVSLRARLVARASPTSSCSSIVALEVPLALNLSRRVDAEVKSEAAGQASSSPRAPSGGSASRRAAAAARADRVGAAARRPGDRGRPRAGALLADSRRARPRRPRTDAPGDRAPRSAAGRPRASATATRSTRTCCSPPCRSLGARTHRRGAGDRRAWTRSARVQRNDVLALIGVGVVALLLGLVWPGSWPARSPTAPRPRRRRPRAWRAATSTRARRWRARREQREVATAFNDMTGQRRPPCCARSATSWPTPRTSCAPRSPGCGCGWRRPALKAAIRRVPSASWPPPSTRPSGSRGSLTELLTLAARGRAPARAAPLDASAAVVEAAVRALAGACRGARPRPRAPRSAAAARRVRRLAPRTSLAVLDNLIENALDQYAPGTTVAIESTPPAATDGWRCSTPGPGLGARRGGARLRAVLPRERGRRAPGGSGLGLTIVRVLARRWAATPASPPAPRAAPVPRCGCRSRRARPATTRRPRPGP